jgi:hypothetical protein
VPLVSYAQRTAHQGGQNVHPCGCFPSGVDERSGGIEEPRQGLPQLGRLEARGEVAFDVGDRALEHVEPVAQRVELGTCDHELVFTETELLGAMTSFVVPLPAALTAVLARPASGGCRRQRPPAPPARRARGTMPTRPAGPFGRADVRRSPWVVTCPNFRHCDGSYQSGRCCWRMVATGRRRSCGATVPRDRMTTNGRRPWRPLR